MEQIIAKYLAELIVGGVTLITAIIRYREVIGFFWPLIKKLWIPFRGFGRWIKMPYEVSKQQAVDGKKIQDVETVLADLSKFIKEKLSPNGGSSPIDALKRIEARQVVESQIQKAVMQDTNVGYFKCDMLGRNEWVNRSYARFIGCGAQELLGFGWKRFIRTHELERYNEVWQAAFRDGCEFEDTVEFTDVHREAVRLKISVTIITGDKNETIGYFGTVVAL